MDCYPAGLSAQRSLYIAQQLLIGARQEQLTSEVNLYKALGGGWHDQTRRGADAAGPAAPGPSS